MFERFYNWDKDSFDKLHEKAYPHSSKATRTSFYQTLKRLEVIYDKPIEELDLIYLKDPVKLYQHIKESKYTDNTLTTTFTSILKMLKMLIHHQKALFLIMMAIPTSLQVTLLQ